MVKVSLSGNTIYLRLLAIKGFDAIRPQYNCFISMIISVDTLCGFAPSLVVIESHENHNATRINICLKCLGSAKELYDCANKTYIDFIDIIG